MNQDQYRLRPVRGYALLRADTPIAQLAGPAVIQSAMGGGKTPLLIVVASLGLITT
jgi:hypothetical protein